MGFIKSIEKPSGIEFTYHRVTSLMVFTNVQNLIEVGSYVTKKKRQDEVECMARMKAGDTSIEPTVLVEATMIVAPYDPDMTIESAYQYLLTLPEFEDAEMEDTEFMLDAEATIPEIQEELAANEPTPEESSEEGE